MECDDCKRLKECVFRTLRELTTSITAIMGVLKAKGLMSDEEFNQFNAVSKDAWDRVQNRN